ncbi:MAG: nucleotidyltransferase family protein [Candidatus Thermoplasmatota archaeon]|nr:nucleotidyltransferase family protein [Candidatus Thermoplasmatota archaeon]
MDAMKEMQAVFPLIKDRFKVRKIGLFGSYSKGSQRPESDLDILVEFNETTFDNYMGLYLYLSDRFDKKVDLVTTGALNKRLRESILEQVIWIAS